jgi:hypothetical protein
MDFQSRPMNQKTHTKFPSITTKPKAKKKKKSTKEKKSNTTRKLTNNNENTA